ncbi:molybdenum cofactor guanylyltransferase MobA [Helicobacter jaachi]|uniref:Molybdenum cofactor guanylyltransferase MobA n=1 Tax=Helicobacter jaachi TaxID=1677920 RepID=A0A4U8TAX6_9HELI|nr:molybdenum cofactor guanylyltransferase MobA [Helicobacter jaachi]TLD96318.1 molybdenum cofactor guanylyltransferase MobA [Helicobacter jaachi]
MQKIDTPCVILAGGKSSRLGADKTQVDFGNRTLSEWIFLHLQSMCEQVYMSVKQTDKFNFHAPFLIESSPIYAPIIGMINAFKQLDSQSLLFISVDTPFITQKTLSHIASAQNPIAFAQSTDRAHYLISKWDKSMLDALLWAFKSKDYSLHRIVESHPHTAIEASEEECFNINTMTDYHNALKMFENLQ